MPDFESSKKFEAGESGEGNTPKFPSFEEHMARMGKSGERGGEEAEGEDLESLLKKLEEEKRKGLAELEESDKRIAQLKAEIGASDGEGAESEPEGGEGSDESGKEEPGEEEVTHTNERGKKSRGLKALLIGGTILTVVTTLGALVFGGKIFKKGDNANAVPQDTGSPAGYSQPAEASAPGSAEEIVIPGGDTETAEEETPAPDGDGEIVFDGDTETAEKEKGIKDGYGERGMWLSQNKDHDYDYGDAKEVGEICNHDEVEMLKYTAENQVESLADYMAEFPEDLCPEGFYGLKPREIEKKLESLSPEEFDKVKEEAMYALNEAFTRPTVTKHNYHHYGMLLNDESGAVEHENMQLVDKGIGPGVEVVEFYWIDENGEETGSMLINIRRTSADEKGAVNEHEGGLEVLRRGKTNPTPDPWGKDGDSHAGDDVDPSGPVDPDSEVTQEESEGVNDGNENYDAKPGDSSDQNGVGEDGFAESGTTAEGADTDGGRLTGGEDQSGGQMAGENSYQEDNDTGAATDDGGNESQAAAQQDNEVGGDNNSDADEEAAVEGEDF